MDYILDDDDGLNITLDNKTIMRFNLDFMDKEAVKDWIENQELELDVRVNENHFSQWVYCDGDEVGFGLECNNSINYMSVFIPKELAIKAFKEYFKLS